MSPRIAITLAIIAGMSVGTGLVVFGVLELVGLGNEQLSTLIATGAMIVVASGSALLARLLGAFRDLDERE